MPDDSTTVLDHGATVQMPANNAPTKLSALTAEKEFAAADIKRSLGRDVHLREPGTTVLDLDGSELFRRFPLVGGKGFVDVTSRRELGTPLMTFTEGLEWDEKRVIYQAEQAVAMLPWTMIKPQSETFVAYNFPHVAVRFTEDSGAYLYIDAVNGQRVAGGGPHGDGLPGIASFGTPLSVAFSAVKPDFEKHFTCQMAALMAPPVAPAAAEAEAAAPAEPVSSKPKTKIDHFPYVEQENEVWCVPACIQMVLGHYRYDYKQDEIAGQLGLGTLAWPQELQCTRQEFRVLRGIEQMSRHALNVEMSICRSSFWSESKTEIEAQRPVVVIGGGHARVVVGYSETHVPGAAYPTRRLLLFDPEPLGRRGYRQWVEANLMTFDVAFFAAPRRFDFQSAAATNGTAKMAPDAPPVTPASPMIMAPDANTGPGADQPLMSMNVPSNGSPVH
jgi:hypothetical protein